MKGRYCHFDAYLYDAHLSQELLESTEFLVFVEAYGPKYANWLGSIMQGWNIVNYGGKFKPLE